MPCRRNLIAFRVNTRLKRADPRGKPGFSPDVVQQKKFRD
jgi:hypothetical protein